MADTPAFPNIPVDASFPGDALTILNVNDDEATRYILSRILRAAGFLVAEADTGEEALRLAKDQPALVVLDVNLPGIDGFDVCRQIKMDPATRAIPVLHVSATRVESADKAFGLEGGADGYLVQPVEPAELTATVRALLRLSRAEERSRRAAEQWRAIFDAIGDGVCLVGSNGGIHQCNRGMAFLTGLTVEEIAGRKFDDLMRQSFPGYPPPVENHSASGTGRREVVEVSIGTRWLRITAEPVVPGSAAAGTVRVVTDITDVKEAALRHRRFLREILAGVTEGHLRLCDSEADLPTPLPLIGEPVALSQPTLRLLRRQVRDAAQAAGLPHERAIDILTAIGEAGMNAVVHAGVGEAQVCADPESGTVQVWVRDQGAGISEEKLHRATLERGFSSGTGFGHGFWLMLNTSDRVFLLTGPHGTTVVLEQGRVPAPPGWLPT